jgi:hypothetical protein
VIGVPEDISQEEEAEQSFRSTLDEVADKVGARLQKRRPDRRIIQLVDEIRSLKA